MDKEILNLKQKLKFREDGTFKILSISDIHGGPNYSDQLPPAMEAIVEKVQPDLVILGGDTGGLHGVHVENPDELRTLLDCVSLPMEKRNIPWAHVFGNHDDNYGCPREEQEPVYEEYPCCVSKWGEKDLDGVANYVLPVLSHDEKRIAFNVWGLDSHNNNSALKKQCGLPDDTNIRLKNGFCFGCGDSMPSTEQVIWYYNTSKEMERYNGAKIPGLMYMHIPLPEMYLVLQNREECKFQGETRETAGCAEYNTGLFCAALRRGDIRAFAFGHDHINDCEGEYCGIKMTYMGSINYDCYQDDDLRGGRVYEIKEEDGEITTYMVRIRDLLGKAGDRKSFPRGVRQPGE